MSDGEITTLNQSIFIDTTKPVLEITTPIAETFSGDINDSSLDTFDGKLSGKVSDSNGIGITKLQYKIDSSSWNDIDIKYGWSIDNVEFSGDQGARIISFRASDGLNTTLDQITVYYDEAEPTLIQDSIVKVSDETTSTTVDDTNIDSLDFNYFIKLTGTVSDTSLLTSLQLSINGKENLYLMLCNCPYVF